METANDINFLSALLPLTGVVFLIVLGVLLLNQQFKKKLLTQKLKQEKLNAQHQFELLQASIAVQEEERKRIARDLHDELGAALSMARMHLMHIEQETALQPAQITHMQQVRGMLENALASTRRISHELMPPLLESFGLAQTLEAMATDLNKLGKLQLEVITGNYTHRLPLAAELGLYRVCMELVNNTIRHAQATHIRLHLQQQAGSVTLHYNDNGKGFDETNLKKGIGQHSIETRIHALNGTVTIKNSEQGGIAVTAEIPLMG